MSKRIPLTQGQFAIVDDADFEWLNQWKWRATKSRSTYYAIRSVQQNGKKAFIYMHRIILSPPPSRETDHINHDGLDNRRSNLRPCTRGENRQNSRKQASCSSRYIGVSWNKAKGNWRAYIMFSGRQHHRGHFDDERAAARAYNIAAREYFGEFAKLNIIEDQ